MQTRNKVYLYYFVATIIFILIIYIFAKIDNKEQIFIASSTFYIANFVVTMWLYTSRYKINLRKNAKIKPITYVISVRPLRNNYYKRVEKVIESAYKQRGKKEILVFSATENDKDFYEKLTDKYKIKVYYGYSKVEALNRAIEVAKYDYICYLDDNTILPDNTSKYYFESMNDDDVVAVSGYRYYDINNGNKFVNFFARTTFSNFFGEKFKLQGRNCFVNVSGSNELFKKSFLKENKFKLEHINRTEDADISVRIYCKNAKIVIDRRIKSSDLPPKTLYGLLSQRIRWAEGWIQTYLQNFKDIIKMKNRRVKFYLLWRIISVFAGTFIYPISLSLIFSQPHTTGLAIFIMNWLSGTIQLSYAELKLKEKVISILTYPLLFTISYLFDLASLLKMVRRDKDWIRTQKD